MEPLIPAPMVVDCDSSDSSSLSSHAVEIFPTAPPPVSSSRDTIVVGYVFGPKKMKTMGDVMMLTAEATARVASAAAPSGCDVSIISADTHSDGGPSTPSPVHHFMPSSVMTRISNSKSAIEDDCTSVQSSGSSGSSSLGSSLSLMDLSPSFGLLNNGQNINKVKVRMDKSEGRGERRDDDGSSTHQRGQHAVCDDNTPLISSDTPLARRFAPRLASRHPSPYSPPPPPPPHRSSCHSTWTHL